MASGLFARLVGRLPLFGHAFDLLAIESLNRATLSFRSDSNCPVLSLTGVSMYEPYEQKAKPVRIRSLVPARLLLLIEIEVAVRNT